MPPINRKYPALTAISATGRTADKVVVAGSEWTRVVVLTTSSLAFKFEGTIDQGAASPTWSKLYAVNATGSGVGIVPDTAITPATGDVYYVYTSGVETLALNVSAGTGTWQAESGVGIPPFLSSSGNVVQCYSFLCDATDELLISASARKLYGIEVFSISAAPVYAKLYDKATAPASTDTPVKRTGVPANSTSTLGAGTNQGNPNYIALTAGLGIRVVTGIADNNNTAVTASQVLVNVYWSA